MPSRGCSSAKKASWIIFTFLMMSALAFAQTAVDGSDATDDVYQGTSVSVYWNSFATATDHMQVTIYSNIADIAGSTVFASNDTSTGIAYAANGTYTNATLGSILTSGATYYIRVQSHDALHVVQQNAFTNGFIADTSAPTAGTRFARTSTGR